MDVAMTTKMRWFKFFAGDWSSDTQGMSPVAKGVYIDMLCMQWNGRRLPASVDELAMIFPDVNAKVYRELLQHFQEIDGWLVNERLEEERADAKSRSENGKVAAKKKWQSQSECGGNAKSDAAALPSRMDPQRQSHCYTDTEAETDTETETESEGESCSAHRAASAKPSDSIWWDPSAGWTGITDEDRADWAVAYPAVNQAQELAKADQWLKGNPEKARKKKWRAFITRWFGKAQERGGSMASAPRRPMRDESHIPEDVHPDDRRLFFSPEGKPREPAIWRKKNGDWCI
jgi:uncharacterized protein YdaU (DUF1376 family)